jgi:ankyrin repeat protein
MDQLRTAFIKEAIWHGDLAGAEALLARHPQLAQSDIHIAAILGDPTSVRKFLSLDPNNATARSGPYNANALTHLALSKYLRLGRRPSADFVQAATALLDAGADPNAGFWTTGKFPEHETPLYGAAGVAHHADLTRLLLQRGADPNDEEAVYHSPETDDYAAMQLLVETGRITGRNLTMMLIRKHDWHDYEGAKYLLEHGASPNGERDRGWHPLHHALARDNSLALIRLLLDHGADPAVINEGLSAVARAAHHGRSDVLELFRQRGFSTDQHGVTRLIAACTVGDPARAAAIAAEEPLLKEELLAMGGTLLARFTGVGNLPGVKCLLDLGVDVNTPFVEGDGYFSIPPNSLAIHVAAWRIQPAVIRLLLERGAYADRADINGRTPLMLVVKAAVDSYWTERRSPDPIAALLEAGASTAGVPFPSGYAEADVLLEKYR